MLAVSDRLIEAALFVLIGIFFDFFDGLVARLLKVQSELGKELDSLADMVTSGVVPGIVMYQLLSKTSNNDWSVFEKANTLGWANINIDFLPFTGLLLTLAAAYRLAKFNLDERQTSSFIGLPTPAMALFIISLPAVLMYGNNEFVESLILNKYFLIATTLIFSVLMNAEIPLFSLKFKNLSFKNNIIEILFVIVSVILVILLKTTAIPILILFYIFVSIIKNSLSKV